jgi:hypothetical protein
MERRSARVFAGAGQRLGRVLLVAACLVAQGCAHSLVERAVRARGGPMQSLYRVVDARVHEGFPGSWSWETGYRVPEFLRWTVHTYGEDQSFVYDGEDVILYLGSASLPVEPAAAAAFRSQARWFAVGALDVLADPARVGWEELPSSELAPGAAHGLRARFRDDGSSYVLLFDDRDLLIALEGEVAIPPVGAGRLRAEYDDFREVDGYTLAYTGRYLLDGRPLADEVVRRCVPNDPALTAASFAP